MLDRRFTAALLMLVLIQGTSLGAENPVKISLLGVVGPRNEIVTIADVARISGGDLITRRRIAALDIAEIGGERSTRSVSKQQVTVRIMLAGIASDDFKVSGPERVLFKTGNQRSSQSRILETLKRDMARRLGVGPADVELRLMRPLTVDPDELFQSGVRLEHFLPPTIRPGTVTVRIAIHQDEKLVRTIALSLEVLLAREVYVARRELESGAIISTDDVVMQRRFLSGQVAEYVASSVVGNRLRKTIRPGSVLTDLDLQRSSPAQKEIVVRTRDIVEVVARGRGLQVKISGAVALQQGAIGDAIRVKNPGSGRNGRVLTARVVDAGVVEIQL